MKLKKLVKKLNKAEMKHNLHNAKKFWIKILKKSFKHKDTTRVQ